MGSLDGIISLGSWGGQGGDHWIYIASREITEIIIHESVNIKSISFKEAGGFISGTFGGRNPNDRGEEKKVEIHWPSEYLKSISGTSGDYNGLVVIRSLSFITNLTTYGPFGTTDGGVPFSIPMANSVVVGFHGRSGYYLDALGIFVQPVQPHGSIPLGLWGGPGRNPFSFRTEIDGHLEYLRSITGAYGNSPTDNSFSIPVEGSAVIGFHGRGGYYLDAIGIHVKPREIEEAISIGPWGGDGGNQWSYKTNRGISQIVIYVGLNIKSISFQDTTDLDSGTFGGNNSNDLGERKTVHINWPSEHLTSISGMYGNYASLTTITSLSFTTNRATYGPFGSALGTSFSIPINNNTVVGFHGRAGHYLDAIGIFVKPYAAS